MFVRNHRVVKLVVAMVFSVLLSSLRISKASRSTSMRALTTFSSRSMAMSCVTSQYGVYTSRLQQSVGLEGRKRQPMRLLSTTSTLEDVSTTINTDEEVAEEEDVDTSYLSGEEEYLRAQQPSGVVVNLRKKKVRQHVNPLSHTYQAPLQLTSTWLQDNYPQPTQPLIIDIGCAKGSWALKMAEQHKTKNVLGLEIRRPIVELCLHRKAFRKLTNVHFFSSNANVDLTNILISLQQQAIPIEMLCIQFPDPHFKKRNHKRRVVNPVFVDSLAQYLPPHTKVFVQSDVAEVADDMVLHLRESKYFEAMQGYLVDELNKNISPNNVQTEREISSLRRDLPVYRMLFQRNQEVYEGRSISI